MFGVTYVLCSYTGYYMYYMWFDKSRFNNNVIFETKSSSGSSHFLLLRSEDKNKDNVIKCFKMC